MSIPSRNCVAQEINGGKRGSTAWVIFLWLLVAAAAPTAYSQEQPANSQLQPDASMPAAPANRFT